MLKNDNFKGIKDLDFADSEKDEKTKKNKKEHNYQTYFIIPSPNSS